MIVFSEHALERMEERGATREEVTQTIRNGTSTPARGGRLSFRHDMSFDDEWNGRYFAHKQLEVIALLDDGDWIVITVICRYY